MQDFYAHPQSELKSSFAFSPVWKEQLRYYETLGLHAWAGRVPYTITSTWSFCQYCADVAVAAMLDTNLQEASSWTFLELGAGIGQFSIRFLTCLSKTMQRHKLHCTVHYLFCDASTQVLNALKHHPQLHKFTNIRLSFHKVCVLAHSPIHCSPPLPNTIEQLFVLANYFFDSLYHNAFFLDKGCIYPAYTHYTPVTHYTQSVAHGKVDFALEKKTTFTRFYKHPDLENTLKAHAALPIERFLMPEGAIKILDWLIAKTPHCIVHVADKGYTDATSSWYAERFDFCEDGALSACVNFFALDHYLKKRYKATSWTSPSPHATDRINFCTGLWAISAQEDKPISHLDTVTCMSTLQNTYLDQYCLHKELPSRPTAQHISCLIRQSHYEPTTLQRLANLSMQYSDLEAIERCKSHLSNTTCRITYCPHAQNKTLFQDLFTLALYPPNVHTDIAKTLLSTYHSYYGNDTLYILLSEKLQPYL